MISYGHAHTATTWPVAYRCTHKALSHYSAVQDTILSCTNTYFFDQALHQYSKEEIIEANLMHAEAAIVRWRLWIPSLHCLSVLALHVL